MLTLLIAIAIGQQNLRVPLTPVVDGRPVIVHLVSRDHVVSITTGPHGPLYSAKTKDGVMVASGLTLQQLRDEHPEVYQRLAPAIAPAATVDAGDRQQFLLDASAQLD
jgi:hypothetical protein